MQSIYKDLKSVEKSFEGCIRFEKVSKAIFTLCLMALFIASPGCSIKKMAANKLGDAMAKGGNTFASEEDTELVRAAAPFSLKLMETILAETPRHQGLLLATSRNFSEFAYAFVQMDADEMESKDLATANAMRDRAIRLYLRARQYGIRSLEVKHPDFEKKLRQNPKQALKACKKNDVPQLYWTSLAWAAAISLSKDNPDLIADLFYVEEMVDRILELDPDFGEGAVYSFLINFESARRNTPGDPIPRAQKAFDRAMELSHGCLAGPLVSYAEVVCVKKQNLAEFKSTLQKALDLDPKIHPEYQLENLIYQRRARWLLSRTEDLFLVEQKEEKP